MGITGYLTGVIIALLTYTFYRLFEGLRYWSRRGIAGPYSLPIVGSLLPVVLRQISIGDIWTKFYRDFHNNRFIGAYNFVDPLLLLTWPEDIETMLIKEFSRFTDRSPPINEKVNPHGANLFGLVGPRWRALRMKITPTFTSGRIREMVPQIADCWENVDVFLQKNKGPYEVKDLTSMFSVDVIASVAFGLDSKKLGDPDTEFRKKSKEFFNFNIYRLIIFLVNISYPKFAGWLGVSAIPKSITNYFADITRNTIEFRRKNKVIRNDFLQLMMQLQEKGNVDVTSWDADDDYLKISDKSTVESIEITEDLIISQAVIFFTAGFESTANTILFSLFEINRQPEILEKVSKEVESVISKHGAFNFDALKEMVYLEQCIKESLRLHPAIFSLARKCNEEYQFPNSDLKLKVGTTVGVPVYGLHTDAKYWPDPFVYDPDRFGQDKTIIPGTYIPFGAGPRMCIAMRFALTEVKVALAKLLLNYNIEMHPDTEIPIRSNNQSFLNSPISPVLFNLSRKRDKLL